MTLTSRHWLIFSVVSIISVVLWCLLMYPQFAFLDLSVTHEQALEISKKYIADTYDINPDDYVSATVFSGRRNSDIFLQKALGFPGELNFFKQHDFELFFWKTRFFKENQEEQFFVTVSAATGEITAFSHHIPETKVQKHYDKKHSKTKALAFLKKRFHFNPARYTLSADLTKVRENRTDYSFEWERTGVRIPWGGSSTDNIAGKLLTSVTVSGNEIMSFNKKFLRIPTAFTRHIKRVHNTGRNFILVFRFCFLALLTAAIFFVISRRTDRMLHILKRPCITAAIFLVVCEIALYLNGFEYILFEYPTTSSFASYFWHFFSDLLLASFAAAFVFLMPFLAGEPLFYEIFPQKRDKTILHHIRSTFFSRNVSQSILIGYFTALIMLGLQAVLFYFGEHRLNVWMEYRWMSSFSASYLPFIPAIVIGISASLSEEIMFRLFGISFFKKILKNTLLAVILTSIIWGFGHSNYPVYPMWFRGIEVTFLGFILAFIFLNYGLIPALVAHYLFDAFWTAANFLFGKSSPEVFYSSLAALLWPLLLSLTAFFMNQRENERPIIWNLSASQKHNLEILKYYLQRHPTHMEGKREDAVQNIVKHGWDIAVVETAFDELS